MAKISIIVLLCGKHMFINLAKHSIFNIFIWMGCPPQRNPYMCVRISLRTNTVGQLSQKLYNLFDPDNFLIKIWYLYTFELLLSKTPTLLI
jgi:hypothetical protein